VAGAFPNYVCSHHVTALLNPNIAVYVPLFPKSLPDVGTLLGHPKAVPDMPLISAVQFNDRGWDHEDNLGESSSCCVQHYSSCWLLCTFDLPRSQI
jgi:hypothetical protein